MIAAFDRGHHNQVPDSTTLLRAEIRAVEGSPMHHESVCSRTRLAIGNAVFATGQPA
jgi:hypothetical protein